MANYIAMHGGEGPSSFFRNLSIQEQGSELTKILLRTSIGESLELQTDLKIFSIADLGCPVGPNTFSFVKNIIEVVQNKYMSCSHEQNVPEFHVFFTDHVSNDFNTLFRALPSDRQYLAAGVPGSFQGRLFPQSSINVMHSVFALRWLTRVPEEVTKEDSWNKGRITYALSSIQVEEAFRAQFFRDAKAFFDARSVELAPGGLLAILVPCRPEGTLPSESVFVHYFECLGNALADMVKEGLVSEGLADSFNVPVFFPTASEVNQVVSSNKHLRTERLEKICYPPKLYAPEGIELAKVHTRALLGDTMCKHFGPSIVDELFDRYPEKLEKFSHSPLHTSVEKLENLFLLVKRSDTS